MKIQSGDIGNIAEIRLGRDHVSFMAQGRPILSGPHDRPPCPLFLFAFPPARTPGYFVQVLCILQLYAFPSNCNLLKSIFLLANGPLAFAVPVWRNSLVFHDLEKITSLYIHVYPGLLLYALRWYPSSPSAAATLDACGSMDVKDLLPAAVVYLAWQIMYYVKIEILDKARLEADPELQTSLRWLAKDHKNALHRLVLRLTRATGVLAPDERFDHRTLKTKSIFILTQFIYTLLTCLPALVIYHSFQLHVAYGLGMFTVAVFNGVRCSVLSGVMMSLMSISTPMRVHDM